MHWRAPMASVDESGPAVPLHDARAGEDRDADDARLRARRALQAARRKMAGGPWAFRLRQPLKTMNIGYRKYLAAPHTVEARLFTGQAMRCVLPDLISQHIYRFGFH